MQCIIDIQHISIKNLIILLSEEGTGIKIQYKIFYIYIYILNNMVKEFHPFV